jgi:hypothetical protein
MCVRALDIFNSRCHVAVTSRSQHFCLDSGPASDRCVICCSCAYDGDVGVFWQPISVIAAVEGLRQVALALQHLHTRGFTHADLRCRNVLVASIVPFKLKLTNHVWNSLIVPLSTLAGPGDSGTRNIGTPASGSPNNTASGNDSASAGDHHRTFGPARGGEHRMQRRFRPGGVLLPVRYRPPELVKPRRPAHSNKPQADLRSAVPGDGTPLAASTPSSVCSPLAFTGTSDIVSGNPEVSASESLRLATSPTFLELTTTRMSDAYSHPCVNASESPQALTVITTASGSVDTGNSVSAVDHDDGEQAETACESASLEAAMYVH